MLQEYRLKAHLMGSAFEFILVTADQAAAAQLLLQQCIAEVQRIEALLTEFNPKSFTTQIAQNAGIQAVEVPEEMYALIERSLSLSNLSEGAFDITASGFRQLYNFNNGPGHLASAEKRSKALAKTGYQKIELPASKQVFLDTPGMKIGFGGIGKGYAADCVKRLMQSRGVESGVINASGDLTVWGRRPDNSPWRIGIAHPDNPAEIILWLPVHQSLSLATSGNYEQYFEHNGKRYGHTIDPRNGLPVTGIKSATVISPSAELSDALATAVTVLGSTAGTAMINQLPETHCMLMDDNNKRYYSTKLAVNQTASIA